MCAELLAWTSVNHSLSLYPPSVDDSAELSPAVQNGAVNLALWKNGSRPATRATQAPKCLQRAMCMLVPVEDRESAGEMREDNQVVLRKREWKA